MSKPIQMLYLIKRKEAFYQLAPEEKNAITQYTLQATIKAGGKRLAICDSTWSSSDCEFFELTEFDDISSVQKRIDLYERSNIFRYYEISTVLGTPLEQICHDDIEVD